MSSGSDSKNLVLGLISTGRDRPSVRKKPIASPPPGEIRRRYRLIAKTVGWPDAVPIPGR